MVADQSWTPVSTLDDRLDDAEEILSDGSDREPRSPRPPLSRPTQWVVGLAALKVLAAAVVLVVAAHQPGASSLSFPAGFIGIQLLAFGGAGAVLLFAHARDLRTAQLGAVLVTVASAYSTSNVVALAHHLRAFQVLAPLYPDAFLPVLLAQFVEVFPQRLPDRPTAHVFHRVLMRIGWVAGGGLFSLNALAGWNVLPGAQWVMALERRSAGGTAYWTIVFALILLTVPAAWTGGQFLNPAERRRVRLFWLSFWIGLGPFVFMVLAGAVPLYGAGFTNWMVRGWFLTAVEVLLATVPVTVTYAVMVRHLLPLRVVLRRTAQYVFARWTLAGVLILPVVLFIVEGYLHREERIASAFSGRGISLIVASMMASVALIMREDILRLVDRWFFREGYDPRQVLLTLATQARQARGLDELAATLTSAVDRALRPESVVVLVRNHVGDFVSPFGSVEPLRARSVLVELLAAAAEPLDVTLDQSSALRWLPRAEQQWLVDSYSRLLVPLHAPEGALVGIISLAERRSELPFSSEDRQLLVTIAEAGAATVEYHAATATRHGAESALTDFSTQSARPLSLASECHGCGRVEAGGERDCGRCGTPLRPSGIPHIMFGKFRFEERVGQGGMGIVYRATDLALDRTVAIKTLPGTSPEDTQRLRREAKAMAAVAHRHLAIVYGVESWRGRPMLICEFMERGTLAHRLARGRLAYAEALSLGVALAEALDVIHGSGLLHRDIKPSNIGYAFDGVPKLLDFGLVYMFTQAPVTNSVSREGQTPCMSDDVAPVSLSLTQPLVGTPLYLSPEAIRGKRPSVAFDLWSLNVLLCEALTGQHPFRGRSLGDTLDRIQVSDLSSARRDWPGIPAGVTAYLERALASDPGFRPRTALEVAEALRALESSR